MDRAKLVAMLEYRLSTFSDELDDFVSEFFAELDGPDKYGNYSKTVGENPQKLFACNFSSGSPYNGKNSIVVDGDKVKFGNDDYRNCHSNFTNVTSAFILLELIEKEIPGIYFFQGGSILEHGEFTHGTEYINSARTSSLLGKIRNCTHGFFFGLLGDQEFVYSACGFRSCSEEFKNFATHHFGMKPKGGSTIQTMNTPNTMMDFIKVVRESIVLPTGVKHPRGISEIQKTESYNEHYVDMNSVQSAIDKVCLLRSVDLIAKRIPEETSEYLYQDEDEKQTKKAVLKEPENSGFFAWLKSLF